MINFTINFIFLYIFIDVLLEDQNRNEIDFNSIENAWHITLQVDFMYIPMLRYDIHMLDETSENK